MLVRICRVALRSDITEVKPKEDADERDHANRDETDGEIFTKPGQKVTVVAALSDASKLLATVMLDGIGGSK